MDASRRALDRLRAERLRSHRFSAPAPTVAAAGAHMLATQAQEFWGGRWALAQRTRGHPTLSRVDAAFDRGELVRSWTMRGTIHAIPPADLAWVLSLTGARQERVGAAIRAREGIDDDVLRAAERVARAALRGGNRLTRRELFDVLEQGGVSTAGQRGYHLLATMSLRLVVCQGPVVPRPGAPTREQYLVLTEDWIEASAAPADPLAEFFVRFVASHGPAGPRDFAWWSGLPLGMARDAAERAGERLIEVAEGRFATAGTKPRRSAAAPRVLALPPFEEYYISYADRSAVCAPEFLAAVGPASNGIVRPVLVADGEIVGTWTHSLAVTRHTDDPLPELFVPDAATEAEIADALERYRSFITG